MIRVATWLAVAVLGVGAAAVFVWFVADLRRHLGRRDD